MAGSPLSSPRELRARWYLQVDKYGKSVNEICSLFGMSRKTYYKWYRRDHPFGMTGRGPRKIHPHTKLTPNIKVDIIKTKRKLNYGPLKMKIYLKDRYSLNISTTAIYRFYKKKRLIRRPQKKLKWYTPMKTPYLALNLGENVQLDVKYVPGIEGTWEYQYRFIDTVSNLQYAVNMFFKDALSSIKALKLAEQYFQFTITGIQTDNGGEFRGRFHDYLISNNIIHRYIPKRSAPWNGKVERANRSIDDEYYLNPNRPWDTLQAYTNWYNYERPHLGKGMNGITPYQKFLSLTSKSVTLEG